jgi:hypothetical protein
MLSVQAEQLAALEVQAVLAAAPLLILAHILLRVAQLELRNPQQARLAALAQHLRAAKAVTQTQLLLAPLAKMAAVAVARLAPMATAALAAHQAMAPQGLQIKAAVAATAADQPVRQAQAVLGEQAETTLLAPAAAQSPAALAALAAVAAAAAGLAGLALSASTSLA